MTWYTTTDKNTLDYSKPICASNEDGTEYYLLMPCLERSYNIKGYNWFSITRGKYNTRVDWPTVEEAVNRSTSYHNIRNCEIMLGEV